MNRATTRAPHCDRARSAVRRKHSPVQALYAGWTLLVLLIALATPAVAAKTRQERVPPRAINDALQLLADGQPTRASRALEELLRQARSAGDDHARGLLLWGLASVRVEQDRYDDAAALAAQSRRLWEEKGDPMWSRTTTRLEEAARALSRSERPPDPVLRTRFLQQLGLLELTQLRAGNALRNFDDALEDLDHERHPEELATLSLERGLTLLLLRQPEPATADFAQFTRTLKEVAPQLVPVMSQFVDLLLAYSSGDLDRVLEQLEAVEQTYGDHLPPEFSDFLELAKQLNDDRWDEAAVTCKRITNRKFSAEDRSPMALLQATQQAICAAVDLFDAPTDQGFPVIKTFKLVNQLRLAVNEQPPVVQGALRSLIGTLVSALADRDSAAPAASVAAVGQVLGSFGKLLKNYAPSGLRAGADSSLSDLFVDLISNEARNDDPEATFEHAEHVRARELLDRLSGIGPEATEGADDRDRIAELRRHRDALEQRLTEGAWDGSPAAALDAARAELTQVRRELDGAFQQMALRPATLKRSDPLPLAAIRQALDEDTTLVAYLTSPSGTENTLAWVVDTREIHQVDLPVNARELEQRIGYLRRLLESHGDLGDLPMRLYRDLWAPLRDLIRTERVVLIPHGPLQELPFAVLRDPDDGRYLIETKTLVQAPSATAYAQLRKRPATRSGTVLILGDPDGTLPAARSEARELATIWGVRPLLGADASERALRRQVPGPWLIHVASHGVIGQENPRFSRLLLAGTGDGTGDPRTDGRLELHEVMDELDLHGTDLVVLSACATGSGPRTGGDEVANFARAVLAAGARAVVTAAWRVDDRATTPLMTDLHRALRAGHDAAEALRFAQRTAINSTDRSHPSDWAAFEVQGASQPSRTERVDDSKPSGKRVARGHDRTTDR